jgi:hypothetical protein
MLRNRFLPLIGLVFVALVLASVFVGGNLPGGSASAATVLHYYQTHGHHPAGQGFLLGLGVIAGMFFFGYLRAYMRQDRDNRWLASTGFGGAIIFAVSGMLSAGALLALNDTPRVLTAPTAQVFNYIQGDMSYSFMQAGLGVFFLATGIAAVRTRLLPVWLGWVTIVLGLAAASLFLTFIAFFGIGLWVIVVAIMLSVRASKTRPELVEPSKHALPDLSG